jgi:hypothetical protein
MHKCNLCDKIFPSESKLSAHKNRKNPCNSIKQSMECTICNIKFEHKSHLERHNKTKKHINNYNIQIANNITNNFNNINNYNNIMNCHLDVILNVFEKTNVNKLSITDIENEYFDTKHLDNIFKEFEDENDIYPSNEYFIYCFNYFIKLFTKLNFNIAYSENHNCRCISFKRIDTNIIEYQVLSIDNITNEYTWDIINYNIFIEKFLELMQNINNRFKNNNLTKVLDYVNKYKSKFLLDDMCKIKLENNLLDEYNKFKQSKEDIHKELDAEELRRFEYYRDLQLEAKKMTLKRNALENFKNEIRTHLPEYTLTN